jgi:recombination protein RecT
MSAQLQTSEIVEKVTDFIGKQETHFTKLNENCYNRLDFAKESEFAMMSLLKNNYLLDTARQNPDSLYSAIASVASIGISLSPAEKLAYLVPRKINGQQAICLDISYVGLIKLATDSGRVSALKAELVFEHDTYIYKGFDKDPEFSANPFGDRGDLIGVYAKALLSDGNVLVENMTIKEVFAIRDDSEAYKSALRKGTDSYQYKGNVWVRFEGEMIKKTVIKRAFKTLPKSDGSERMAEAIQVIDQHEGIDFEAKELPKIEYTEDQQIEYQKCIDEGDFFNLAGVITSLDSESQLQLRSLCVPEAEKGQKGAAKKAFKDKLEDGRMRLEDAVNNIREFLDDGNESDIEEIISESSPFTVEHIMNNLSVEHKAALVRLGV